MDGQAHQSLQAEVAEGGSEVLDGQSVQAGESHQGQAAEGHTETKACQEAVYVAGAVATTFALWQCQGKLWRPKGTEG